MAFSIKRVSGQLESSDGNTAVLPNALGDGRGMVVQKVLLANGGATDASLNIHQLRSGQSVGSNVDAANLLVPGVDVRAGEKVNPDLQGQMIPDGEALVFTAPTQPISYSVSFWEEDAPPAPPD